MSKSMQITFGGDVVDCPLFNTDSDFNVEYHGWDMEEVKELNNSIRQQWLSGNSGGQKSEFGVQVKPGKDGKSILRIGDDRFGINIETDLANTNVVVTKDGKEILSTGEEESVNIECGSTECDEDNNNADEPETDETHEECSETREGPGINTVTTTKIIDGAEVTETITTEITDEGNMRTEKKTTVIETKSSRGTHRRQMCESKTTVANPATTAGASFEVTCGDGSINFPQGSNHCEHIEVSGDNTRVINISVEQPSQGNQVNVERRKRSEVTIETDDKGQDSKDVVTTTKIIGDSEVTETKTTEVENDGNVRTERNTTVTETKRPGGGRHVHHSYESKSTFNSPSTSGGTIEINTTRETAAQRRARENKGVSAKTNPFKAQDAQNPVAKPAVRASSSSGSSDVASSNIEKLLKWIQKRVNQYPAVEVKNFTSSWEDGIALCALMNYLLGNDVINPEEVSATDKLKNFTMAIDAATVAGVPKLLEPQELADGKIERRSMITYLHLVYTRLFADKKEEEKK